MGVLIPGRVERQGDRSVVKGNGRGICPAHGSFPGQNRLTQKRMPLFWCQ